MQHIRTEAACANRHICAFILTHLTRELEEFERLIERNGLDALVFRHLGELRLLFLSC